MSDPNSHCLPSNWCWTTTEQITSNYDGVRKPVKASLRASRSGSYPYYGASEIIDHVDEFLFEGDYLLIAEDGANLLSRSTPIAFRASGQFWVNNHAHIVRTNGDIPLKYLEYYFNSINLQFHITGSAQPKLTQAALNSIRVPLSPVAEQHRIVAEIEKQFSHLDAAVAALKRVQTNLKRYRTTVLRSACEGRLVPTEAELARQEGRDYEHADALLQRILCERRARWEADQLAKLEAQGRLPLNDTWKAKYQEPETPHASDLQQLPEGWTWASVQQLATLVTDGDHNPPKRVASGIPHLTAKNILNSHISLQGCTFIVRADADRVFARYKPTPGDIIVTCVGTIGRTAIVPDGLLFSPDRNLAAIRLVTPGIRNKYIKTVMLSPNGQKTLMGASGSTAQPHLYLNDLRAILIPVPPLAEQERIVAEVERRLSIVEGVEATVAADLKRAERLRQAILQRAFSGKLVPQDPNDEPASVLLERIRAERTTVKPEPTKPKSRKPRQLALNVEEE